MILKKIVTGQIPRIFRFISLVSPCGLAGQASVAPQKLPQNLLRALTSYPLHAIQLQKIYAFIFLMMITTNGFCETGCKDDLSFALNQKNVDLTTNTNQRLDLVVYRIYRERACKYFLTFSKGSAPDYNRKLYLNYPNTNIPVQLYKDSSNSITLMDLPEVTSETNIITGNFPNSNTAPPIGHTYFASLGTIPLGLPSGYYSDTFKVSLYEGTLSHDYHLVNDQTVKISYFIPSTIALSLVDSGAPFNEYATARDIDFGTMSSGMTQNFDAIIKSNSGYRLFFSSQNGGKMLHNSIAATVSYSTQINGTQVNLVPNIPIQVASGSGNLPIDGQRLNVRLTIGNITTQPAGSYSDSMTITVQSN